MIKESTNETFEFKYIETAPVAGQPELVGSVLAGRMKSLLRRRRRLLKKSGVAGDGR